MTARDRDATGGKVTIALGLNSLGDDNADTRNADCDRTLEVLDLCGELGIDRHVIVTIGKHNTESFERTIQYLVDHRVSFNRSPLVARGSGREHWEDKAFSREDLERSFHPALRSHVNGYVSFTPFFLSPELYERASGGLGDDGIPHNPPIGCWVGNWITLTAEGDVSVCPVLLDSLSAGNVREKRLDELVLTSELFQRITDRSQLEGRCGRCRYQYTCGGCRAMAFYHTGNYMAEDPTCFFEPVDATTVSEHEDETNRWFEKYLLVARHAGFFTRKKPGEAPAAAPSSDEPSPSSDFTKP